ncbi:MAG: hypothetical protein QM768_08015 [Agriterribacter sp.]
MFELRYNVAVENNSKIAIQYVDSHQSTNIDEETNQAIKSTGDFVLQYDDSKVPAQYTGIWSNEQKIETRILTNGSTKFFKPLASSGSNVIKVFNGKPVND